MQERPQDASTISVPCIIFDGRSEAVLPGEVFIGGQFSRVNGQSQVGLASLQRTNGSSTPGWHGGVNDGGHVFAFHKFARLLGHDQPVFGVKAIGVDGSRKPPETVEEIAATLKGASELTRRAASIAVSAGPLSSVVPRPS